MRRRDKMTISHAQADTLKRMLWVFHIPEANYPDFETISEDEYNALLVRIADGAAGGAMPAHAPDRAHPAQIAFIISKAGIAFGNGFAPRLRAIIKKQYPHYTAPINTLTRREAARIMLILDRMVAPDHAMRVAEHQADLSVIAANTKG